MFFYFLNKIQYLRHSAQAMIRQYHLHFYARFEMQIKFRLSHQLRFLAHFLKLLLLGFSNFLLCFRN